jgi:ATP phosphoribosyltransferase
VGRSHDSQVVEEVLNTPRSPLVVTADKAYDSQTARQQIKDEGGWRRIATRYDKLARNFLAAATLIGALYWIKL